MNLENKSVCFEPGKQIRLLLISVIYSHSCLSHWLLFVMAVYCERLIVIRLAYLNADFSYDYEVLRIMIILTEEPHAGSGSCGLLLE